MTSQLVRGLSVGPGVYWSRWLGLSERDGLVEVGVYGGAGRGRTDVAGFTWGFAFAPFRSPVLEPDLHSRLAEVQFQGQFFAREHVRIRSAFECTFELFELKRRECCSATMKKKSLNTIIIPLAINFDECPHLLFKSNSLFDVLNRKNQQNHLKTKTSVSCPPRGVMRATDA